MSFVRSFLSLSDERTAMSQNLASNDYPTASETVGKISYAYTFIILLKI